MKPFVLPFLAAALVLAAFMVLDVQAVAQQPTGAAGAADVWKRHTIDAASKAEGRLGADGVRLGDANGDGYLDVVTGWEEGNAIRVCLHPGSDAVRKPWPAVTVGRAADAEDAMFVDLDADGNLDVVSCSEGKTRAIHFHWAPSRGEYMNAAAWRTEIVPVSQDRSAWMFACPFDVDLDGHVDVVVGAKGPDAQLAWLRNPGGRARDTAAWELNPLTNVGWIMSIVAVDLDGDGVDEIIYSDRRSATSGIYYLKRLGEPPWLSPPQPIGAVGEEVLFLDVVDANRDGLLDIAVAIKRVGFGYLYQPIHLSDKWVRSNQALVDDRQRFGSPKAIRLADLSGDGRLQAAITCEGADGHLSGVYALDYLPQSTTATAENMPEARLRQAISVADISGPAGVKYDRIELLDLDGDGDLDLMTCEERDNVGVVWYENPAR